MGNDVFYDKTAQRYRYVASGRFVARSTYIDIQKQFINQKIVELTAHSEEFFNNPTKENLEKASKILKDIHIANGVVGAGGADKMFANDYLAIASTLKRHYGLSDNDPKPYGLRQLFDQLQNGDVKSAEALRVRLRMFGQSGEQSKYAVEKNKQIVAGKTEAKRILGATDIHCSECLQYAARGWGSLSDLVLPGTRCSCLTNCLCSVIYR
jgi:hypothetical protein